MVVGLQSQGWLVLLWQVLCQLPEAEQRLKGWYWSLSIQTHDLQNLQNASLWSCPQPRPCHVSSPLPCETSSEHILAFRTSQQGEQGKV